MTIADAGCALFVRSFPLFNGSGPELAISGIGIGWIYSLKSSTERISLAGEFTGDAWDFGLGPTSTFDPDAGQYHPRIFAGQWNHTGQLLWLDTWPTNDQAPNLPWNDLAGVAIDAHDNLYIAESNAPQVLSRFDPTGRRVWSMTLATTQEPNDIPLAINGNELVLAGLVEPPIPFVFGSTTLQPVGQRMYVAAMDTDGTPHWIRTSPRAEGPSAIAVSGDGTVVIAGASYWVSDVGNGDLWSPPYMAPTAFVAKLDPSGAPIWARTFREIAPNPFSWTGDPAQDPNGFVSVIDVYTLDDGAVALGGALFGQVDMGFGWLFEHHAVTGYLERLSP